MAKRSIFQYANFCESNFKRNMANRCVEIDTTFCSDLSIAEFCEVFMRDKNAVEKTVKQVLKSWKKNEHYLVQFLHAFCAKSHEHYAMLKDENKDLRQFSFEKHKEYCEYYIERFYKLKDEVLNQFKGDEEAMARIYQEID